MLTEITGCSLNVENGGDVRQKRFSCFWASLRECAQGKRAPWGSSRPLWLCVICWEVLGRKGRAKISGFDHSAAVVSGKSASQLLGSPLCKAGPARPSLWVLGDCLDGAAGEHGVLLWGVSWEIPTLITDKQSLSQTHLMKSVFWHLLPTLGSYWGVIPPCPKCKTGYETPSSEPVCLSAEIMGPGLAGVPVPSPASPWSAPDQAAHPEHQPRDWCTWPRTSLLARSGNRRAGEIALAFLSQSLLPNSNHLLLWEKRWDAA